MMAKAYMTSYKMPVIITRGNNVYGPHQFPEKLVPKFTLLASRGDNLPIHGEGKSVRSYLYVEDVAEAFDVVLHKVSHLFIGLGNILGNIAKQSILHTTEGMQSKGNAAGRGWEQSLQLLAAASV